MGTAFRMHIFTVTAGSSIIPMRIGEAPAAVGVIHSNMLVGAVLGIAFWRYVPVWLLTLIDALIIGMLAISTAGAGEHR